MHNVVASITAYRNVVSLRKDGGDLRCLSIHVMQESTQRCRPRNKVPRYALQISQQFTRPRRDFGRETRFTSESAQASHAYDLSKHT